jgi:membrane-associated phospholipid phosphatase
MHQLDLTFKHYLGNLRLEEILGLFLLLVTSLFAVYGNLFLNLNPSGIAASLRAGFILLSTFLFFGYVSIQSNTRTFNVIRDFGPVFFVIAIYLNIHDTIQIINPADFHYTLVDWEALLFGVQPAVWIEKYYQPALTEWMSFSYFSYYWIPLTLVITLYAGNRKKAFRTVMLNMMICYYVGFFLYIFFPAASPYLVIPEQFTFDVWKDSGMISAIVQAIVGLSPERPRDAFPSLHTSITLLTTIMAWRFNTKLFWIYLPMAVTLPIATIYLRYHFVIDVLVGLFVPLVTLYLTPRIEYYWRMIVSWKGNKTAHE